MEVHHPVNKASSLGLLTGSQDLNNCRIRNAKKQIKKRILRQLAFDSESGLPSQVSSDPGSAYDPG